MSDPAATALIACALLLLFASAHDVATRTIPDWVSLALAAIGLALRAADGTLSWSLLAASLVFAASAFCWRRGWLGGGDVKLLTACALLSPPVLVPTLLLGTALAGGLLAMTYLALRYRARAGGGIAARRPASLPARVLRAEAWRIKRGGPLPYACAICAGALFVLIGK